MLHAKYNSNMRPYFKNHSKHIVKELLKARKEINIAVAWLTDNEIITTLAEQSRKGVKIEILISSRLFDKNFKRKQEITTLFLFHSKCEIYKIGEDDIVNGSLMHHKFCTIDYETVITGSYNWTRNASRNDEDIIIIKDIDVASQYNKQFSEIKNRVSNARIWFSKLDYLWQTKLKDIFQLDHEPTELELEEIFAKEKLVLENAPLSLRKEWEKEYFDKILNQFEYPNEEEIELCKRVSQFEFDAIPDLSPLSFMQNLKKLDCSGLNIKTIEPIKELISLEELSLSFNDNLELDFKFLEKLKNLKILTCVVEKIKNWEVIENLTELEELHFSGFLHDQITNINPLSKLKKLKKLEIDGFNIKSLGPIPELSNIEVLSLEYTNITDFEPLLKLKKLRSLSIDLYKNTYDKLLDFEKRHPFYSENKRNYENIISYISNVN